MNKIETRKTAKLSDFDRRVLTVYADISLETGEKNVQINTPPPRENSHKPVMLKV